MNKVAKRFMFLWSLRVPLRSRGWHKTPFEIMLEQFDMVRLFYSEDAVFRQLVRNACRREYVDRAPRRSRVVPADARSNSMRVYRLLLEHFGFDV